MKMRVRNRTLLAKLLRQVDWHKSSAAPNIVVMFCKALEVNGGLNCLNIHIIESLNPVGQALHARKSGNREKV